MKQELNVALLKKDFQYLKEGIDDIKKKLDGVVMNDSEYQELRIKVNNLWDAKNRMVGWMLGAGIAGGGIATLLKGITTNILAALK